MINYTFLTYSNDNIMRSKMTFKKIYKDVSIAFFKRIAKKLYCHKI